MQEREAWGREDTRASTSEGEGDALRCFLQRQAEAVEGSGYAVVIRPPHLCKERDALLHSVGAVVLCKHLVVFVGGGNEDDAGDVFKAVDPFPPL